MVADMLWVGGEVRARVIEAAIQADAGWGGKRHAAPTPALAMLLACSTDRSVTESAPQEGHPATPSAAMPPKRDAGASCRTVADVQAKLDTQAGRTGAPGPSPAAAGSSPPTPAARRSQPVETRTPVPTALQVQQLETVLSTGEKKVKNLGLSFSNSIFKRAQVRPGGRRAAARGEGWRGCRCSLQWRQRQLQRGWRCPSATGMPSLYSSCAMLLLLLRCRRRLRSASRSTRCSLAGVAFVCPPSCPTTYSGGIACFASCTRPWVADA